jgi:signal transduction histidine kinase
LLDMSSQMLRRWFDMSQLRWTVAVTVVPYGLLAVLVVFTIAIKHSAGASLFVDLGLCALMAVWMLVLFTARPPWREKPAVMAVFLTGLLVLMLVLVLRDPWFGCMTVAGYLYAFRVLHWPWLLVGVAAVAAVAGTAQATGIRTDSVLGVIEFLAVLAVNMVPMCMFAWTVWRGARRNEERNRTLEQLHETNQRLAATLAENAGLHQRLLARAREAGVLDERQRMAREIHDTLAQGLIGIITQLQAAEQAGDDPAGWRRHVTAATTLARESLVEARRSVRALRPEPLQTARLSEALADVAGRWSTLHGLTVEVTTTGTARPLRPAAEAALLRTAQEALANVAKHAHATRVGVTLSYLENEVALDVRDDGHGFDPTRVDAQADGDGGGFGLVAMRQRIEGLAGTLQIESEPGTGTAISARVPAAGEMA